MGLTSRSTGLGALNEMFRVKVKSDDDLVVALAGNPNTGKSTVFNALTGLKQHTGNWPGKTVCNAQGRYNHNHREFVLVDLPGTYSLLANSAEEEVARDFICFGHPHATVVVTDATCLERNLNLVLQIMEMTGRVVLCVNLLDEAERKRIHVDLDQLSVILGIPVVGTNARDGRGLTALKDAVCMVAQGTIKPAPLQVTYEPAVEQAVEIVQTAVQQQLSSTLDARWLALRLLDGDATTLGSLCEYLECDPAGHPEIAAAVETACTRLREHGIGPNQLRDGIVSCLVKTAERIAGRVVSMESGLHNAQDRKIDSVLTSRRWGIPVMLALLGAIVWITIQGANYPSDLLATGLFWIEEQLTAWFMSIGAPPWLHGVLVLGVYRTLAWVVAVMLPPMAIFFPLFTLLEDLGYLPRVAFNLDSFFKRACAHGKQALTMCMGFGCNAAGIIACRIIDSPRERLIAIITNNFVPCNGRFPILIALVTIFIAGSVGRFSSLVATLGVLGAIVSGVVITLVVSRILSRTILRGLASSFTLELPPYRKPQVGRVLVRSLVDRTLFVLGRAVIVAAPAGLVIWVMANVVVGDVSLLDRFAGTLDPFSRLIGLDGYILVAFILGLPANEIVIPIIIMSYMGTGSMLELESLGDLRSLLVSHGWTWLTAVCVMLFSLNHWPCGTTLLTIRKETQSWKWTAVSFLVPTVTGIIVCFVVAQGVRLLGLV